MASIDVPVIHVQTRRTFTILTDTKRKAENTVESLRYAGIVRDGCTVVSKRDRAARLQTTTITLNYPLDNAAVTRLRQW